MKLTLIGYGHIVPHTTQTRKTVPRLYLTADAPFLLGDQPVFKNFFSDFPHGGMLLDWNDAGKEVTARADHLRQRMSVELTRNPSGYWTIVSIKLLDTVEFAPEFTLYHADLASFPHQDRIPADVRTHVQENVATPRRGFFTKYPHGPWLTTSGRPEDIRLEKAV